MIYQKIDDFLTSRGNRLFTYQSQALRHAPIIAQIMLHILKLKYRFHYQRDRNGHVISIIAWVSKISKDINGDKTCNPINRLKLKQQFLKNFNPESFIDKAQNFFSSNYEFDGTVTFDDYQYALNYTFELIGLEKADIARSLSTKFPQPN